MNTRTISVWAAIACLSLAAGITYCSCDSESSEGGGELGPYDCDGRQCERSFYSEDASDDALFVNVCCGSDDGDGTLGSPFRTVGKALEVSVEGGELAVAAGTYEEDGLIVDRMVSIIGAGRERCKIVSADDSATLSVTAAAAFVKGFSLEGAGPTGLRAADADGVRLQALRVEGYQAGKGDPGAVGVHVAGCNDFELDDLELNGNGSFGLVVNGGSGKATGISAVGNGGPDDGAGIVVAEGSSVDIGTPGATPGDISAGGCVASDGGATGVMVSGASARIHGLLASNNAGGGAAFVNCVGDVTDTVLSGSEVTLSARFGVALYSCPATVEDNTITGATEENPYPGYCLSAVADDDSDTALLVHNNSISDCGASAVLADGGISATVTQNTIGTTGQGGIWLQNGVAGLEVGDNDIAGAGAAGLAVTLKSSALVTNNRIASTGFGEIYDFSHHQNIEMADGIIIAAVHAAGSVTLAGNRVELSERAGIIFDNVQSAAVTLGDDNIVAGNKGVGISLQNGAETIASEHNLDTAITYSAEGVPPNAGEGDLVVDKEFPIVQSLLEPSSLSVCIPPDCTD